MIWQRIRVEIDIPSPHPLTPSQSGTYDGYVQLDEAGKPVLTSQGHVLLIGHDRRPTLQITEKQYLESEKV